MFSEAISEYQRGLSPDLNILYHKYLTYGSVLDYVRKQVGADALATDNYARIIVGDAPATGFQHFFGKMETANKLLNLLQVQNLSAYLLHSIILSKKQ